MYYLLYQYTYILQTSSDFEVTKGWSYGSYIDLISMKYVEVALFVSTPFAGRRLRRCRLRPMRIVRHWRMSSQRHAPWYHKDIPRKMGEKGWGWLRYDRYDRYDRYPHQFPHQFICFLAELGTRGQTCNIFPHQFCEGSWNPWAVSRGDPPDRCHQVVTCT